jgi:hypothetical protein
MADRKGPWDQAVKRCLVDQVEEPVLQDDPHNERGHDANGHAEQAVGGKHLRDQGPEDHRHHHMDDNAGHDRAGCGHAPRPQHDMADVADRLPESTVGCEVVQHHPHGHRHSPDDAPRDSGLDSIRPHVTHLRFVASLRASPASVHAQPRKPQETFTTVG